MIESYIIPHLHDLYHDSLAIWSHEVFIRILRDERKTTNSRKYCKTAPNHHSLTLNHDCPSFIKTVALFQSSKSLRIDKRSLGSARH